MPTCEQRLVEQSLVDSVDKWGSDIIDSKSCECKSQNSISGILKNSSCCWQLSYCLPVLGDMRCYSKGSLGDHQLWLTNSSNLSK